ncbi:MAG: hypothetical protein ACI9EP_000397 [Oceanospirillaceae bacterium]|jgi:hypothetical protein
MNWAIKEQTTLLYSLPETTPKNAYIERLHRTARHNLLALNQFGVIEHTIIWRSGNGPIIIFVHTG